MPFWTDLLGGGTGGAYTSSSTTTVTTRRVYTTSAAATGPVYWTDYNNPVQWLATSTPTTASSGAVYWTAMDPQSQTQTAQATYLNQQAAMQQSLYDQQRQHDYLALRGWQITGIGGRELFRPAAPALITHEQRLAEDRALYALAVAAHDEQEAARLQRQIEQLELANAEARRQVEERRQLAREEQARHAVARSRAQELLIEHLTPAQRESFKALGWFVVQGGKSGTKYRITSRGVAGNIEVLAKGGGDYDRATHRLCCHATDGNIPNADQWLAQKIMLELAEDDFLRKANRHAA